MPDAANVAKTDHRKVENLFDRYEGGDESVVAQVCSELTVHTAIEEEVLYPALADIPDGDQLRQEAEHEHQEVKEAIEAIQQDPGDAATVREKMQAIVQGVKHHVEEEESTVLPRMEQALGQDRMEALGEKLLSAKRGQLVATGAIGDASKEELYEMAKAAGISGRSDMTKDQLIDALQSG